jgi:hypothetical protein
MLVERDKLRAERENSRVTEELTARTKEVEELKDRLNFCDKEWQARLSAEIDKWQTRLAEHQQDVETERDKMAEAIAGMMCSSFWAGGIRHITVYRLMYSHTIAANSNRYCYSVCCNGLELKCFILLSRNNM